MYPLNNCVCFEHSIKELTYCCVSNDNRMIQ